VERYASREMLRVFSPRHRFETWRRLWIALAEAELELGLPIKEEAVAEMKAGLSELDFEKAAEYEGRFRHDVMAHVHLFGDVAPSARGIIHLGATSAFVGDNTDLIQHREALLIIRARILRCIAALADFAKEHRALATLGFTHFQPAQPTTVGKRATLWTQDFLLDLEEIEFRLETLRFRGIRGTTGTQASFLSLLDGDHAKVDRLERLVAEKMGFSRSFGVTGQTSPRKVDQALLATLAGVGASASKMGNDLRLLAHLREVEEPFEKEQIGSSAMPYKRNPMRAERICALSRHVIALAQDPAFTAATQWLERTLDDSANRRVAVPDAYLALDGVLVLVENVAGGLVVNPMVIQANLAQHLPFLATETVLMLATQRGGDRQALHETIRKHAMDAARLMKEEGTRADLLERIAADPAFDMSMEELEELVDPLDFVGRAPEQVDRFLEEWVAPVLNRYSHSSLSIIGDPDVRV
jgi:adenylosuccinate lyase